MTGDEILRKYAEHTFLRMTMVVSDGVGVAANAVRRHSERSEESKKI